MLRTTDGTFIPCAESTEFGPELVGPAANWGEESGLLGMGHLLAVGSTPAVRVGHVGAVADPVRRNDRQPLSHLPEPRRVLGPHFGEVLPGLVRRLALVSGRLQAVKGLVELLAVYERIG